MQYWHARHGAPAHAEPVRINVLPTSTDTSLAPRKGTTKWKHEAVWLVAIFTMYTTTHGHLWQELAELQAPLPPQPELDEWGFPIEPPSAATAYADDAFESDTHSTVVPDADVADVQVATTAVERYLIGLSTDTTRDVIITRAIANNRKVMATRAEQPATQTAEHPVDMSTAIRCARH